MVEAYKTPTHPILGLGMRGNSSLHFATYVETLKLLLVFYGDELDIGGWVLVPLQRELLVPVAVARLIPILCRISMTIAQMGVVLIWVTHAT